MIISAINDFLNYAVLRKEEGRREEKYKMKVIVYGIMNTVKHIFVHFQKLH